MSSAAQAPTEEALDAWDLHGRTFHSRLILGSGKFSLPLIRAVVDNGGAEMVTVALRRANVGGLENILDHKNITFMAGVDYDELPKNSFGHTIFTGPVDDFYGQPFGKLPYRSPRFEHKTLHQDKVLRSAKSMVNSGLANHGWSFINIDDTWQGKRGGPLNALQPNEKFPDMKKLCDDIHALGLKAGIYSSPWVTTYAGFSGDGSDNEKGEWTRIEGYPAYTVNQHLGKYSFAANDAKQFAAWGIDYLKYDWNPNNVEHTKIMSDALRSSGRDVVFSLSNSAPFKDIAELSKLANCWRTTGDIWDTWETPGEYQMSVSEIGFNQDAWTKVARPGHWNDTDMLVVGYVGWGPKLHATNLTPAEQYTHITLWCMLSAPMLIGCDMDRLDAFTLNLLTNDEVLAINQDALGKQASRVATIGAIDVYRKELEDGTLAFAFFNRGDIPHTITAKLDRLGMNAKQQARDLWRQKDLGTFEKAMPVTVQPHNVILLKMTEVK